ncbi:MAG: phage tail protein [Rhodocyclaceae bacterium]
MGGLTSNGGTERAGDIKYHAANAIPYGWLRANGAAVSRETYAALFAAIGTTYGAGDGATTFNLPDLRGEFVRGFDDGRGVDSGRVFGSAQTHAYASHTHNVTSYTAETGGNNAALTATAVNAPGTTATSATGSTETRPRNIAMLACIKY